MNIKKSILILGLSSFISLNAADTNSGKHFVLSAAFGFTAETIIHKEYYQYDDFDKIALGTLLGTIPGLAKELTDDKFSTSDLAFDIAGSLSGAILSNYVNNNTSIFISHNHEKEQTKLNLAFNF